MALIWATVQGTSGVLVSKYCLGCATMSFCVLESARDLLLPHAAERVSYFQTRCIQRLSQMLFPVYLLACLLSQSINVELAGLTLWYCNKCSQPGHAHRNHRMVMANSPEFCSVFYLYHDNSRMVCAPCCGLVWEKTSRCSNLSSGKSYHRRHSQQSMQLISDELDEDLCMHIPFYHGS